MSTLTLDFDAPIFPEPRFRNSDPETSRLAAKRAAFKASPNRVLAARLLRDFGPQNDFELAKRSGIKQTSIGKRRGELCEVAYVAAVPGLKRPSDTDSPSQVWRLTEAGAHWLKEQDGK